MTLAWAWAVVVGSSVGLASGQGCGPALARPAYECKRRHQVNCSGTGAKTFVASVVRTRHAEHGIPPGCV